MDTEKQLSDYERFMQALDVAKGETSPIPLGELVCAENALFSFEASDPDGLMLATFSILQDGNDRPTNFTGMISLIKSEIVGEGNSASSMLTVGFYTDKGYEQKQCALPRLHRLMSHPREMGSMVFCIRDGRLVREEIRPIQNSEQTEGSNVTQNPSSQVA